MTETDAEIIQHVRRMDTPTDADPRRRYTQAQLEMAIRLARRGAAMQWRPISEAPKDGTWMLVSAPGKEPETACWISSVWLTGWYSGGGRSDSYPPSFCPTHWMPLPPPPKGAEE